MAPCLLPEFVIRVAKGLFDLVVVVVVGILPGPMRKPTDDQQFRLIDSIVIAAIATARGAHLHLQEASTIAASVEFVSLVLLDCVAFALLQGSVPPRLAEVLMSSVCLICRRRERNSMHTVYFMRHPQSASR